MNTFFPRKYQNRQPFYMIISSIFFTDLLFIYASTSHKQFHSLFSKTFHILSSSYLPMSTFSSVPSSGGSAAKRRSSSSLVDGSFRHCWIIFFLNVVVHFSKNLPETSSPNIRTKFCSTKARIISENFKISQPKVLIV